MCLSSDRCLDKPEPTSAYSRRKGAAPGDPSLIQKLDEQRDELDRELRYLERIEAPEVKTHYNFGKPPRFSPDGNIEIIDLGEFRIEMDMPAKIRAEQ